MGGIPLDNVSEENDPGITATESFKSSKQCNIAASKANRTLAINKKHSHLEDGTVSPPG